MEGASSFNPAYARITGLNLYPYIRLGTWGRGVGGNLRARVTVRVQAMLGVIDFDDYKI